MSHCDFHYSHLLPKKPGILPLEETMTKQCRRCGAQFVTKSRIRKRCDTCQTLVSAEKQKKANERLKLRRAARHHIETAAYFEACVVREHVAAGRGWLIDLHDQIDNHLPRMNQSGCLL